MKEELNRTLAGLSDGEQRALLAKEFRKQGSGDEVIKKLLLPRPVMVFSYEPAQMAYLPLTSAY